MNSGTKKTLMIAAAVLAIGAAIYFSSPKNDSTSAVQNAAIDNEQAPALTVAPEASSTASGASLDSDNDGLSDWEEALWHTDPHNPDTDGDGTPDGVEVKEGRDPLKKGPNDLLDENSGQNSDLTNTDQITQDFIQKYVNLKQSGSYNDQTSADLVQSIIQDSLDRVATTSNYTNADLAILSSPSRQDLKNYGNLLAWSILSRWDNVPEKVSDVMGKAASTTMEKAVLQQRLSPIAKAYSGVAKDMAQMKVPAGIAETHVELLNTFVNLSEIVMQMASLNSDPMTALAAMQKQRAGVEQMSADLLRIKTFLDQNGIQFTPNDPGYFISQLAGV